MKEKRQAQFRLWDCIYPIGIYYATCFVVEFVLLLILPDAYQSQVLMQCISCIIAVFLLYRFYKYQQIMRGQYKIWLFSKDENHKKTKIAADTVWIVFAGFCMAILLNNIIGFLGIAQVSKSYAQVQESFYTGRLLLEIVALCIVVPFAEELLYRGIIFNYLRRSFSLQTSMVCSALIFGAVHGNIVQFIYAAVFGLLLAFLAEYTRGIYGAVLAHMTANLLSVLRAETSLFSFANTVPLQVVLTAAALVVEVAALYMILKKSKE